MSKNNLTSKEYVHWLGEIKERIRVSQQKAALAVNRELLDLYWFIGEALANKKSEWGDKFIDNLARDLKIEFPDMKGFSKRNLEYMRRWFDFYSSNIEFAQQAVAQLQIDPRFLTTQQLVAQSSELSQQAVDQNLKSLLVNVPWGTHIVILTKTKSPEEAFFYLVKTIQNNWSRNSLINQIQTDLYNRQGKALTNFALTLPEPNADLAQEIIKNPYNFDFLTLAENVRELEFERALIQHMKNFMLELGKGFAYVGNQYNVNVEGDDFFLDLLFFNMNLNCYVIFELKVGEFKPEFAGKLNMYVNAVNEQVKLPNHEETIGVLLCKTPNETVVKYSLKGINSPLGVSEYTFQTVLPDDIAAELPTIEQFEEEIAAEMEGLKDPLEIKRAKILELIQKSTQPEISQAINAEEVTTIVEQVYIPLIEIINNSSKITELKSYFLRVHEEFRVENLFAKDIDSFKKRFEEIPVPRSIGYSLYFKGFKKLGTEAFDLRIELLIELDEFKYKFNIHNNYFNSSPKIYGEYYNKQELNFIVQKTIECTYDELEKRLTNETN